MLTERRVSAVWQMEEQQTLGEGAKIVASIYEAFRRGDVHMLSTLFAPDAQARQTPLLPWGGSYQGIIGIMRHVGKLLELVDWHVVVDEYIEAGDHVVVIGRSRGVVRANGKEFDVRLAHVWSLRDGRVVRLESYIDTSKMLEALNP
jgi:ketosteroid isomerase-like protein